MAMQNGVPDAAADEMRVQMQVISEMLEAARAIAHKSLQEQEGNKTELAGALMQLDAATDVRLVPVHQIEVGTMIKSTALALQ